jgi:hypothetical protein
MPLGIKENVLRLDITMCDTLRVQIRNAGENLFETTLNLAWRHMSLLDGGVEISARTEFHDFAPVLVLILNEVDSLNNVNVVQG